MDEPIAVNRVTITRELFAESHEAIFSLRRQKMLLYAGVVFLAFGLIFLAFQSRIPNGLQLSVPMVLTGIVVVIWALTLEKSDLKKKYRAFVRRNGEKAARVIVCDAAGLAVNTGNGEPVRIEYTEVREHRETPHLWLLLCSGGVGVQLAKDGFETGSWEELLQAIDRAKEEAAALRELL